MADISHTHTDIGYTSMERAETKLLRTPSVIHIPEHMRGKFIPNRKHVEYKVYMFNGTKVQPTKMRLAEPLMKLV